MTVALLLAHDLGFASSVAGAVAISLAIGVFIGLFRAFGILQMGLPPFIMTLATMHALRGIGFVITNGSTISIDNDAFTGFSRASFLGFSWTDGTWFAIPMLFWMVIVVAVPLYILHPPHQVPLGPLSPRHRREQGGRRSVRHQRHGDDLSCLHHIGLLRRRRRHSGRDADRHRQPGSGRRVGIAGDRLVGHRRHQPLRRVRLGAGPCGRLIKGQVFLWKDGQNWEDLWDMDGVITPP
jgi:hypothetical protein